MTGRAEQQVRYWLTEKGEAALADEVPTDQPQPEQREVEVVDLVAALRTSVEAAKVRRAARQAAGR